MTDGRATGAGRTATVAGRTPRTPRCLPTWSCPTSCPTSRMATTTALATAMIATTAATATAKNRAPPRRAPRYSRRTSHSSLAGSLADCPSLIAPLSAADAATRDNATLPPRGATVVAGGPPRLLVPHRRGGRAGRDEQGRGRGRGRGRGGRRRRAGGGADGAGGGRAVRFARLKKEQLWREHDELAAARDAARADLAAARRAREEARAGSGSGRGRRRPSRRRGRGSGSRGRRRRCGGRRRPWRRSRPHCPPRAARWRRRGGRWRTTRGRWRAARPRWCSARSPAWRPLKLNLFLTVYISNMSVLTPL